MVIEKSSSIGKTNLRSLPQINYPEDLRELSVEELPKICREFHEDIIQEVSVSPGYFASLLRVIEITVVLHYAFDTLNSKLIWGMGHQACGHRILTRRRELSSTNRKLHGLRPFPTPLEDQYDTFTCGYTSSSISAALGMAVAAKKNGGNDKKIVAITGDGAMSGGLVLEGLDNVSSTPNGLLIILNDNDMNIGHTAGGMGKYLLALDTNATYNKLRFRVS